MTEPLGRADSLGGQALLRSKLAVPRPRPGALERPGLVERLRSVAAPGRLVLFVAGAGWGKSTAVASWVLTGSDAGRSVWFSADADDGDAARVWAYLLAGLAAVDPAAFTRSIELLNAQGPDVIGDVVPAVINELSALTEPLTVVIDDYHLVVDDDVHRRMAVLLQHLPATLRVVIISRVRPPLPLTRLRGQGRLADFGVDDVRMSAAEAAQLLSGETGTAWTDAEVDQVHRRTEGWAAGLHLAALAVRARVDDVAAVVAEWGRDNRLLGEYLLEEVLARLPEDVRELLRRTSILERFCPALCEAVTRRPDAATLLARVEREQLFLVPLDGRGEWYRYHHLFAAVLRRELDRTEPDLVVELQRRAAAWFTAADLPVEAVQHALASGDHALSSDLVAAHGPLVSSLGYVDTALGWFKQLGEQACRSDPRLGVARAIVAGHACRVAEMTRWAALAEEAAAQPEITTDVVDEVRFQLAVTKWGAAMFAGDTTSALQAAEEATALAAAAPPGWSASPMTMLGLSRCRSGQLTEAFDLLAHAGAVAAQNGDHLAVVVSRGVQAVIAARLGATAEAQRLAAEAETSTRRHQLSEHFHASHLHFARGWVDWQQGRHRAARTEFHRTVELLRHSPLQVETAEALTALAITEHRLGRTGPARAHLDEACRLIETCPDPGELVADPRTVALADPAAAADPVTAVAARLSAREIEVLAKLADGLTNATIATHLGLSRRTVDAHLRTIYRKIGVNTRAAATRYALEHTLARTAQKPRKTT